MSDSTFAVTRFENRNGVISWRVSGLLAGVRIRKNFKSKEEAAAEKATLELKEFQATSGLRSVRTFLADDQLREAAAAYCRLADHPKSLLFYLDYALANYREPARGRTLADAVPAYYAAKQRQHAVGLVSDCQLTTIRRHLAVLQGHFPRATVAELTVERLTAYFHRGNAGPKTYNNRRGVVATFLKFAFQNDWIVANPIEKIPHHRIAHRRGSARTLTADRAAQLMAFVEGFRDGSLVPFFALLLFAGIRPCLRTGEILKLRPEDIRLDTGVIHIEPEVSKVRMKRNVTIQPNLAAWLRAYQGSRGNHLPYDADEIRRVFQNVCLTAVEDDGLVFQPGFMEIEPTQDLRRFGGFRVTIPVRLGNTRIQVQVDLGFGDAITPEPRRITYPPADKTISSLTNT